MENHGIDENVVFKFILVGDTGVGKSSILLKYIENKFDFEHHVTVGVDFRSKMVQIDPKNKVKIQIWDTAGQETFGTIVRSFYRDAAGIFLVYDVNVKESFEHLENWLEEVRTNCEYDPIYILVGNQAEDKDRKRQVTYEQGKKFMEDCAIDLFFETSAYNGQNIAELFIEAAKLVTMQYMQDKAEENIPTRSIAGKKSGAKLSSAGNYPPKTQSKGGCC